MNEIVKIGEYNCEVVYFKYSYNNRTAIQLIDTEDGLPFARATINLPDVELEQDEVIIKNYEENEGIYEALVKANIIYPYHKTANNGFIEALICKLKNKRV